MNTDKQKLAQKIHKIAYLTGEFTLRSGQVSDFYFDKYRFESVPELLCEIAEHLLPFIPEDTQLLAGLELGGVPIATALSLKSKIPVVFVRKQAKKYGTCAIAEGQDISNKKILVIEDVITTGGQVLLSVEDLRKRGALIEKVICVIHRSKEDRNLGLEEANLKLQSLFNLNSFA